METNRKIRSISEVAAAIDSLRGDGSAPSQPHRKAVVHCHGVFDLLHIGHIRYLKRARSLGDALVVTVTPDRYVNKGPHRPVFPENLRAEAVAALDCVDFVAINEWPTAVETIRALKPDIYAKGAEYRERRTPEIMSEESALEETGGEMAFIEDITSSSSHLLNKYLSPFPDKVNQYLGQISKTYSASKILQWVNQARGLRVLVVGETIIDEYHYCQTIGRSSKAPLVAMQHLSHERFAGGAAAVANHLAGFCDNVGFLSLVGTRDSEEAWIRGKLKSNVHTTLLHKSESPTIVKRRYRESYFGQPVFEVYMMNDEPLNESDNATLCARLREMVPQYDLVVVTDYGHGMLSSEAIQVLCEKARFLAVNAQVNAGNMGYHFISKYPRADYISMAEQELRLESHSRGGDPHPMLQDLARRLNTASAVVTRGGRGCLCYGRDAGFYEAPALATHVVDRVGAGDAFLAVTSLCAVQAAPLEVLAFLGNVAGAEAVATVGNRDTMEQLPFSRHVEALLK
jgi:rfaE bifunctional protein kinase chain/domain/rfaE bifunctional protein nucleotidyltransferase chain/domain